MAYPLSPVIVHKNSYGPSLRKGFSNTNNLEKLSKAKMGTAASSNKEFPHPKRTYSLPGGDEKLLSKKYQSPKMPAFDSSSSSLQNRRGILAGKGPLKADHSIRAGVRSEFSRNLYNEPLKPLSKKASSISDLRSTVRDDTVTNNNEDLDQISKFDFLSRYNYRNEGSLSKRSEDLLNSAKLKLQGLTKSLSSNRLNKKISVSSNDVSEINDKLSQINLNSGHKSTLKGNKKLMDQRETTNRSRRSSLTSTSRSSSSSQQTTRSKENGIDAPKRKMSTTPTNGDITKRCSSQKFLSGLVGLRNLGNTCFMNSILQCLCKTKLLRELFLSNSRDDLLKGKLAKAFGSLMQDMWTKEEGGFISPLTLKLQVQRFAHQFSGTSQQDSQEFLRFFIEGVHTDLNTIYKKPNLPEIDDSKLSDSEKSDVYWDRYLSRERSVIQDVFVGQLKSTLTCTVCGHRSVTYDPFWDLSLPIPSKSRMDEIPISRCFQAFTQEETLDGDEKPMCEKCKKRRKCTKRFLIERFPKILVLHLKRFSGIRYRTKLETKVDFPIDLRLDEFAATSKGSTSVYTLYGVSNHMGGTHGGHYTAFCKHPDSTKWHCYNDSSVNEISCRRVLSPSAYVLFYELKLSGS